MANKEKFLRLEGVKFEDALKRAMEVKLPKKSQKPSGKKKDTKKA